MMMLLMMMMMMMILLLLLLLLLLFLKVTCLAIFIQLQATASHRIDDADVMNDLQSQ